MSGRGPKGGRHRPGDPRSFAGPERGGGPAPTRRTQSFAEPREPSTPRQRRIRRVAIAMIVVMFLVIVAGIASSL